MSNDFSENCPEPKRVCPMNSPEFIREMMEIKSSLADLRTKFEKEIQETAERRHNRNTAVNSVIDEMRRDILSFDDRLEKVTDLVTTTANMHRDTINILQDHMGREGITTTMKKNEDKLRALEDAQREKKGADKMIAIIWGTLGGVVIVVFEFLMNYIRQGK